MPVFLMVMSFSAFLFSYPWYRMMRYSQIYSFHHVCENPQILQTCLSYQPDHLSSGVNQERLLAYPVHPPSSDHPEKI